MPGPNSQPNGTLRPKVNVTKRSLKCKARKTRIARALYDKATGRVKDEVAKRRG
jgi:hypothetical protein